MLIEPYKFLKDIFNDEKLALHYLIDNNYINKYEKCLKCECKTRLDLKKKLYICRNYKCQKSKSPFAGTIFSKMKLPVNIQLHVLYEFLKKTPSISISSSLEIDKNTISKYSKIFRKYLKGKQLLNKKNKIGGRNSIVELDETKIGKRKYNRGHRVEGVWVIGGIERSKLKNKIENENKKLFMLPIEKRDSESIENIVLKHVKKGTTVYTDLWKGYNNLTKLGFKHGTVNHSKYFKDPITKVHINNIESLWNAVKHSIPIRNRNKKYILLHLKEYEWRRRYREYNIWKQFLKD
jgi:transposase-like protein